LFDHVPRGTGFPALQAPPITDELPLATVRAFSVDDSATTEIDDALSIQGLGTGTVTLGIHIAAPGLAIAPDSAIDQVARHRLSTVYMPGHKVTMLPDEVVQTYTLQEGRDQFLVEARTLATFRHPNIVRVARFFEANQTAYMVLDYERGQSLSDWWRKQQASKPLSEPDLLLLLNPLLDGLAHQFTDPSCQRLPWRAACGGWCRCCRVAPGKGLSHCREGCVWVHSSISRCTGASSSRCQTIMVTLASSSACRLASGPHAWPRPFCMVMSRPSTLNVRP
jgi:hypothetical protein